MEQNKVGNRPVGRENDPERHLASSYGAPLARPSDVSRESTDLMNGMLGLARVYSTQFLSQWLLMLRSGMEFWASLPAQVTESVRAVDSELLKTAEAAESATKEAEEERETQAESARAKAKNREDLKRYQRELIRLDAHQIWLRRKQKGLQGDSVSDWVQAERQYHSQE